MKIWSIQEEADRLRARFEGVNRAAFAREHNIKGGQAMIYQHITGRRPIALDAALAYAAAFGCSLQDISPRLASELQKAAKLSPTPSEASGNPYEVGEPQATYGTPAADDVSIPITNASASMGFGRLQADFDQVVDLMRVTRHWVHTRLPAITGIENLAILTAYGDSMEPTFADGDLMLVDRGVREIKLDAIYVLARSDELFVKRVRRRLEDGALMIQSDNQLYGPPERVENGARAELQVLGRVVWAWRGKKL